MDAGPPPTIAQSKHDRYIVAHAVLGSLAALVLIPAAILVGRYGRSWRHWNNVHAALNTTGAVFIIVAFALSNVVVGGEYTGDGADLHHKLGLAVFIIVLVQGVLGLSSKFIKGPPHNYVTIQAKRNPLRILHIFFGIATAALLYTQVYTGFGEWDQASESMTTTPYGVNIAFWVLFAIEVFAYLVGWPVMEILGRRKRRNYVEMHPEMKETHA